MSDKLKNNIGWFLAGLGVGAVAAIFYAPKSGREIRTPLRLEWMTAVNTWLPWGGMRGSKSVT